MIIEWSQSAGTFHVVRSTYVMWSNERVELSRESLCNRKKNYKLLLSLFVSCMNQGIYYSPLEFMSCKHWNSRETLTCLVPLYYKFSAAVVFFKAIQAIFYSLFCTTHNMAHSSSGELFIQHDCIHVAYSSSSFCVFFFRIVWDVGSCEKV